MSWSTTDISASRYGCATSPGRYRASLDGHTAHTSREETIVVEGRLIVESLRIGTNLEDLKLTVCKISRFQAQGTTPDQPDIWTTLDFEADEARAADLAQAFADALDQPGWYVNFDSPTESFVVFPGQIFRYPRGDKTGRAEAQAHGRQLAIPEPQLDWTV
jgi:hypothetical protein